MNKKRFKDSRIDLDLDDDKLKIRAAGLLKIRAAGLLKIKSGELLKIKPSKLLGFGKLDKLNITRR